MVNANQVSEIAGVSVRTLHHYDAIGLLKPNRNPGNDYRQYSEDDLDILQQILFFRECGFSLAKIKELLSRPDFDRKEAFVLQRKALLHEKQRIETMLATLNKSIENMEGRINMNQHEKFAGFDFSKKNPYDQEARRLWGDEVVDKSAARIEAMSEQERKGISFGMDQLFEELASLRGQDPQASAVQQAMDKMYHYFNKNFGYHYTHEAFAGLGKMYVCDERFTKNIDQYGKGLSEFLAKAMEIYANNQ